MNKTALNVLSNTMTGKYMYVVLSPSGGTWWHYMILSYVFGFFI